MTQLPDFFLLTRRPSGVRLVLLGGALAWMASCSDGRRRQEDEFGPPSLRFEGAENADSESFDRDTDVLKLSCDPRMTFLLGPSEETPGLLDNWLLRPRGNCSGREQCGFVELSVLSADDEAIAQRQSSSLSFVVDFEGIDIDEVAALSARLIVGDTGEPFLLEQEDGSEVEVTSSWQLSLEEPSQCGSMGGAGGGSGQAGGLGGVL